MTCSKTATKGIAGRLKARKDHYHGVHIRQLEEGEPFRLCCKCGEYVGSHAIYLESYRLDAPICPICAHEISSEHNINVING